MAHFTHVLAVLALAVVSAMVHEPAAGHQPTTVSLTTSIRLEHQARSLASAAGSGSAGGNVGDSSSDIKAANSAIAAQWATAKVMLEKAFAGEVSLQSKLATFSDKVDATLSSSFITFDAAKKTISEFLTSLQSDPSYANVTDQLTPILSVIGVGSSGSGLDIGASSNGSATNRTVTTPAPITSGASSSVLVAPVAVALVVAAAFASL